MVFRRADSGEHGLVRGRAVLQQRDLVAHRERTVDDVLLERNLLVQHVHVAGCAFEFRHERVASFRRQLTEGVFESRGLRGAALLHDLGIGQRCATRHQ